MLIEGIIANLDHCVERGESRLVVSMGSIVFVHRIVPILAEFQEISLATSDIVERVYRVISLV